MASTDHDGQIQLGRLSISCYKAVEHTVEILYRRMTMCIHRFKRTVYIKGQGINLKTRLACGSNYN